MGVRHQVQEIQAVRLLTRAFKLLPRDIALTAREALMNLARLHKYVTRPGYSNCFS